MADAQAGRRVAILTADGVERVEARAATRCRPERWRASPSESRTPRGDRAVDGLRLHAQSPAAVFRFGRRIEPAARPYWRRDRYRKSLRLGAGTAGVATGPVSA